MLKKVKVISLVLLGATIMYICLANMHQIEVNFPFIIAAPLMIAAFVVYMIVFGLGFLFAMVLMGIPYYRKSRQVSKLTKELKKYSYDLESQNIKTRFEA